MKSILVFSGAPGIPLLGPSGSSAHLRGIIAGLSSLGHPVRVAVPRLQDRRGAVCDLPPVPITTFSPRKWSFLRSLRERGEVWDGRALANRADLPLPDLIYERYSLFCDGAARLAKVRRIPRIIEINAPLSIERAQFERVWDGAFAEKMERQILTSADRIVAVSSWLADWAVEQLGCDKGRVLHVPNGTSAVRRGDRDQTRQTGQLRGLVIGFLGTMKPWHALDFLPELLEELPEATALLIGEGPVQSPKHERIKMVGRVNPSCVPHWISAIDVGIAPYDPEDGQWWCPLKILDYRAQGVPVVASNVGDCAQLIGGQGAVIADLDPKAWATAIREATDQPRVPVIRRWSQVMSEALDGFFG